MKLFTKILEVFLWGLIATVSLFLFSNLFQAIKKEVWGSTRDIFKFNRGYIDMIDLLWVLVTIYGIYEASRLAQMYIKKENTKPIIDNTVDDTVKN